MPTIAAICNAAKIERANYNTLMGSGRAASWGETSSPEFAIRLGLFTAFKAVGLLTPAAVDYADTLASKKALPKWFVRNPLDNEEQFINSDTFEQWTVGSLLGLMEGGKGEWVEEGAPVRMSFAPRSLAVVIINLHSVRERMLALFQ